MDVKLADVAQIRTGYSFRGKIDDDPTGTLAVLQIKDVRGTGQLALQDCIHIKDGPAYAGHILEAGDVVVQARGSAFPAGQVGTPFHGIAAVGLHVVRPAPDLLPAYLAWLFNHPAMQATLSGMAHGSRIPFLSKSSLADLHVPVPPLETQRRLVGIAVLEREADRLAFELQHLRSEYTAAVTWRAANEPETKP